MRRIIKKLLILFRIPSLINEINIESKIKLCTNQSISTIENFKEEAKVFNLQNEKNKIIIGKGTFVRGELLVFANGGQIAIGENVYVGEFSRIWSNSSVKIGNNVLISHNVNIMDSNAHEMDSIERAASFIKLTNYGHSKEKANVDTSPIVIEDYAWIGFNASILKGVKIGKGAIIGANAVITNDVSPYSVVVGNPAIKIKNSN